MKFILNIFYRVLSRMRAQIVFTYCREATDFGKMKKDNKRNCTG